MEQSPLTLQPRPEAFQQKVVQLYEALLKVRRFPCFSPSKPPLRNQAGEKTHTRQLTCRFLRGCLPIPFIFSREFRFAKGGRFCADSSLSVEVG